MNTKTMEGLVGARTNVNQMNSPIRIYKEARRRGDTATMERAMGYAGEYADKAEEYKAKAHEGMKEDAEEAREKAEAECEEAVRRRREEREKPESGTYSRETEVCLLEISEEGKQLSQNNADMNSTGADETGADTAKTPVIYTRTGEISHTEQSGDISVSV